MGSKEASKFSTLWRLNYETLEAVSAERGAAASAFAALTPEGGSCSAASLLFQGPSIPAPPVRHEGVRVSGLWRQGNLQSRRRSTCGATLWHRSFHPHRQNRFHRHRHHAAERGALRRHRPQTSRAQPLPLPIILCPRIPYHGILHFLYLRCRLPGLQ